MTYWNFEHERATFLDETVMKIPEKSRIKRKALPILTICNIVLFVSSLSIYTSTWLYNVCSQRLNPHLRQFSSYTPLLDTLDLQLQVKKMNGTLYPSHHPSVARLPPSPEVDAIWDEWEITRVYPISSAQILAMGKDPSTATKLPDNIFGLGDDAYASIFDIYHQLHCLNTLRKLIYPDYYTDARHQFTQSQDPKAMFEIHMAHCVDILMQAIQCSGNLNLITMHWVQEESIPFPDMSVNRQCVADFEGLTRWRRENTVDLEKYVEMEKPHDVKQLHSPDEYYKYFRPDLVNPNHLGGANLGEDFNL